MKKVISGFFLQNFQITFDVWFDPRALKNTWRNYPFPSIAVVSIRDRGIRIARMHAFTPVFSRFVRAIAPRSRKKSWKMNRNLWSSFGEIKQKLLDRRCFTGFDSEATHGRAGPRIGIPHLINHRYICANTTTMHSQDSRHFRIPIFIARHEPRLVIDLPRKRTLFRTELCTGWGI